MVMLVFAVLIIPVLALVLGFTYTKNSASTQDVLRFDIARAQQATTHTITEFFEEPVGITRGLAAVAAQDASYLAHEKTADILRSILGAIGQLNSITVTFETGFTCGVARVDAHRRAIQPEIPPEATWLSFYIDTAGRGPRVRHQRFYNGWSHSLANINDIAPRDSLDMPGYIGAKAAKRPFISKPFLNANSGDTVLSISAPIMRNDTFLGAVTAHCTITEVSRFLAASRITPNSITALIDENSEIIAAPVLTEIKQQHPSHSTGRQWLLAELNEAIKEALRNHGSSNNRSTDSLTTIDGEEYHVSLSPIENDMGLTWRMLTITPEDDFVGPLRKTNSEILLLLAALIPLELFLIYRMSRRVSVGIEGISQELSTIRTMHLDQTRLSAIPARVREMVELKNGVSLLYSALRSFSQYIPVGVVKDLVESGKPLALGVENRELTILFSDLENFSTFAQKSAAAQTLEQLSQFLSAATAAIADEQGTVDKFIGDAVMAFWGAPHEVPEHPLHACRAALLIVERLEALNQQWRTEGKPSLRVRIGIHTASVLVGNIGSAERFSYTVIGDGVNVASRLEGVNKQFGSTICLSDNVYARVAKYVSVRPLAPVSVKGREGEFMVYELLGLNS
jgi:class 3 adenylate cyclase